ncbi:MAG: hypothetical protein NC548_60080 [Lachnospiraceae bacterium]|nr:hypothetical protein [Lachnospiraceae bacterium]
MKLRNALRIIKCEHFTVFVYPKGHIKENRGLDETPIATFDVSRNERGKLPSAIEYAKKPVKEIIPHSAGVNLVVEV